ncbi:MAG: RNA polymerase sigma factor [Salibacteraceae bacterium]
MNVTTYNKIVDQHADGLYRFALSMCKSQDDAQDAVQEAFSKLWEKKDQVNVQKIKSYLFTTVHNKMIDQFRKNSRYKSVDVEENIAMTSQASPDLKAVLNEALDTLPEIQKSVVLLRDYEGYDYNEIADITDLSLSQVKVYIFRARQKLKNYIVSMDLVI